MPQNWVIFGGGDVGVESKCQHFTDLVLQDHNKDVSQDFQIIAQFARITIPLLTARYFLPINRFNTVTIFK